VATNLRLSAEAASALRDVSMRTGRSQQDLLRKAVDQYLGLRKGDRELAHAVVSGLVKPPTEFLDAEPTVTLKRGRTTMHRRWPLGPLNAAHRA
jgi:hypothetical protein